MSEQLVKSKDTDKRPAVTNREPNETWHCREYWTGDSKDGQFTNGDGYHYYTMKGDGKIVDAYEYYETDDGEEHCVALPELVAINWFSYFGFEDDELLENVAEQEFEYIKSLRTPDEKDASGQK